jgi:hypothetical protein
MTQIVILPTLMEKRKILIIGMNLIQKKKKNLKVEKISYMMTMMKTINHMKMKMITIGTLRKKKKDEKKNSVVMKMMRMTVNKNKTNNSNK